MISDELFDAGRKLRAMLAQREAERKAARRTATGRLLRRESRNRAVHDAAHIREPIGRGDAELWICYPPSRESALRIREDPVLREALPQTLELMDPDALNGYVAFSKRRAPALPMTTGGLVKWIPVHGGVTYAVKDSFAAVWGFDTMHARSEKVPRTDPEWIRYQCAVLHNGLQVAAELWPKFRRERSEGKRAEMAQALFSIDEAAPGGLIDRLGLEALLSLFTGKVGA